MKSFITQALDLVRSLLQLRHYVRVPYFLIGAIVSSSVVAAVLETGGVALLIPLLQALQSQPVVSAGPSGRTGLSKSLLGIIPGINGPNRVLILCGLVIGCIVLKNAIVFLSQRGAARLRRLVSIDLRDTLYRRLQLADLSFFETSAAGETANVLLLETARTIYIVEYLTFFFQRFSIAAAYLLALFLISWPLTLMTTLLVVGTAPAVAFLFRRQTRSGKQHAELNRQLGTAMVETFSGIRVIRTTNSQAREIARFQQLNIANANADERAVAANAMLMPITETVGAIGGMVLVAAGFYFLVAPGLLRVEMLLGFALILLRLLPLVSQLYGLHGQMLYLGAAARAVGEWMRLPVFPEIPFGNSSPKIERGIEFRDLRHAFPNGTVALDGVSFHVPAGQTVALVGSSGSGKSTLAALMLRLRRPSAGHILIDGQDYWDFSPQEWHRTVGVVEQETFLFHDTIRNNVAYGCPEATETDIWRALETARLADFVQMLPDGLDTMVGERGAMLSGGQRQRLAIARALVRNPKILVLDEATSALDTVSERQVQAALEDARQGRTVIIIAHRLSTIQSADKIVVLDHGRVIEQGSWLELAEAEGAFADLLQATAGSNAS
jgi:subfamily B ATP-binding cassette protein MsbA